MFTRSRLVSSNNNQHIGFPFLIKTPLPKQSPELPQQQPQNIVKKMKWGEPTWFLFHTLSYKIKDEMFLQVKNEILNIFFLICRNLPCSICAEHATQYMQNINFNAIQTKQQLKDLFFEFHNTVNLKK
jgi:hypothetical protein